MKKLLITALAAMLAVNSCSLLDTPVYTVTNAVSYLNYKDGKLMSDGATIFNVTSDATDGNWKTEGNRMYAIFDILNVDYDITLKSYINSIIVNPQKDDNPEDAPGDPVSIMDCSLSGIYLNILTSFYVKKGSETPHDMHLYWSDDTRTMSFILVHDGGGENVINLPESDMELVTRSYCFPIYNLAEEGQTRSLSLTINALSKNSDGTYSAEPFSYSLYGSGVTF